jgi:nucleoside-diphosphate-sugar epimerase
MESCEFAPPAGSKERRRKLGRPRLLIVGCGDVGLRIVARLKDRFRIVALTSSASRVAQLRSAGTVPIVGDLDERGSLARISAFGPRVMHLAPPGNSGSADRRTRNLAHAIVRRKGNRAVYISTTGVYGNVGGRLIDETAPTRPGNERAVRRVDAERTMRTRLRAAVLRVPGIYAHDRLPLERLRQGLPALAPADDVFTNHIHAEDLARITIVALYRGAPGRVYNAVDDSEMRMGDYFDRVADAHRLPRPRRLPRSELKAAVSPVMYSFMNESKRLENRRLKDELRIRLTYPTVADALAEVAGNDKEGRSGG